jgi:hypothetical protein
LALGYIGLQQTVVLTSKVRMADRFGIVDGRELRLMGRFPIVGCICRNFTKILRLLHTLYIYKYLHFDGSFK